MRRVRARGVALPLLCLLAGAAGIASAQSGWSAQLILAPLPSPYLSDWEVDPTVGEIVVTNGTSTTTDITFHYSLTRNGQVLLRGVTDPHTIAAGAAVTFNATSTFGGSADWDRGTQDQIARTGRLPEGEFEACVTVVDPMGFVLVARQCVRFSTQYPDPPGLVFPPNGDTVATQDVLFEWLPVTGPPLADARIAYVLQIAAVNTAARQLPEAALAGSIPHYLEPNLVETSHTYPVGSSPFVPGRTYAWRVQALDGDGRPVATNQGRSEVWTFVYSEPEAEVQRAVASIALTPRRDTLRYSGDTARYEAKAYDADNVEIPGKKVQWRSLDTTIVHVDTLGVVTGVGAGETRVVAAVDGVVDSAVSVMTVPTGLTVGFERFDAATDQPALLELIKSGSYDEVVPKLMDLLQSGQFRIPFPRLPGVMGQVNDAPEGEGPGDGEAREGGPRAGASDRWRTRADETCETVRVPAEAVTDRGRQVWVVPFRLRGGDAELVQQNCMQVNTETVMVVDSTAYCKGTGQEAADSTHEDCPQGRQRWDVDTTYRDTTITTTTQDTVGADVALFGVSWATGVPRVFIAWKPPGDEFAVPGTALRARYWVFNLLRSGAIDSKFLPPQFADFFGDDAFDVGVGLTLYIKRRCGDGGFCDWVRWFYANSSQPDLTIRAFAGVTANEVSIGTSGRGSATALGFNVQASFPVRAWNADLGGISLDSTQFGLMFAAQDSVENPLQQSRAHNVSIGVALTLTVWWSTPNNSWAATGSLGVERDPVKGINKVVASLQLEALWKAWWIRVGNPQIILTRTMQADPIEWSYEITGTLGVGEWNGERATRFGVAGDAGGGDQRGDIGGASLSGGLAEMARWQLKLTRTKGTPRPIGPLTQNDTERQAAQDSLAKWQGIEQALRPKAETDEDVEREWRRANQRITEWQSLLRGLGGPPPPPPSCQRENDGWCWAWSVRASLGPTAFTDLLITLGRFGVEAAKQ